ncbi:competence type IV pilus minor pilin ComGD [Aquibacillus kalidii]|uniref:competence type IV pilus minor pilin ComGD n=1 Tax=Aquibacillus kalidii TaxID=2762597 RepID=UPI0016447A2C|nr:competence type IV pilus minor pilin ComGD [Aquibacillus kalidii]
MKEKGFTFLELVIVLSIISILLVVGSSIQLKTLHTYQLNSFYKLFESDILYLQQFNMVQAEKASLTIDVTNNQYQIKTNVNGKVLIKRTFPKDWVVKLNTLSMPLSFTSDGNLIHPGTFSIKTAYKTYYIYFPFGKGRCYIIDK